MKRYQVFLFMLTIGLIAELMMVYSGDVSPESAVHTLVEACRWGGAFLLIHYITNFRGRQRS